MIITEPGIYTDVSARAYHADPVEGGSVTRTELVELIDATPMHARYLRENRRESTRAMEVGTISHAILTGHLDDIEVIRHSTWNKTAKRIAQDVRRLGRTPVLIDAYDQSIDMIDALQEGLEKLDNDHNLCFLGGKHGLLEAVVVWDEETPHGTVRCRAMLDWIKSDLSASADYKTAHQRLADYVVRNNIEYGLDMQAAFYRRGLRIVGNDGMIPDFVYVWQEMIPPYDFRIVSPSPSHETIGESKIEYALERHAYAVKNNEWPGYDKTGDFVLATPGYEARWLERIGAERDD